MRNPRLADTGQAFAAGTAFSSPQLGNAIRRAIAGQTLGGPKSSVVLGQTTICFWNGEDLFGINLVGFDAAESNGRWTLGNEATLLIPCNWHSESPDAGLMIWIELTPYCPGTHRQLIEFSLENGCSCIFDLADCFYRQTIALALPADLVAGQRLALHIRLPSAATPRAMEGIDDTRQLGFKIHRLVITQSSEEPPAGLDLAPLTSLASPSYQRHPDIAPLGTDAELNLRASHGHPDERQKTLSFLQNFRRMVRQVRENTNRSKIHRLGAALAASQSQINERLDRLEVGVEAGLGRLQYELTSSSQTVKTSITEALDATKSELAATYEMVRLASAELSKLRQEAKELTEGYVFELGRLSKVFGGIEHQVSLLQREAREGNRIYRVQSVGFASALSELTHSTRADKSSLELIGSRVDTIAELCSATNMRLVQEFRRLSNEIEQSTAFRGKMQTALNHQSKELDAIREASREIQQRADTLQEHSAADETFRESVRAAFDHQSEELVKIQTAFNTAFNEVLRRTNVLHEEAAADESFRESVRAEFSHQSLELAKIQTASNEILQRTNALSEDAAVSDAFRQSTRAAFDHQTAELLDVRAKSSALLELTGMLKSQTGDMFSRQARRLLRLDQKTFAVFCDYGPILISASDEKFILHLVDQWGAFEPGTTATIRQFLAQGDGFVDVGAHVGWYTLMAARLVGTSGHVWSFEPSPVNAGLIKRTLFINDVTHLVDLRRAAAGRSKMRGTLHVMPVSAESSLIPIKGSRKSALVNVIRLDDALPSNRPINLIKIDAEGSEFDIIAGLERTLQRNHHCKIIAEFGPAHLSRAGISALKWFGAFERTGRSAFGIDEGTRTFRAITSTEAMNCASINILWMRAT
jgi:FkbM family methyltransferase